MEIVKIIGVYNANAGILGELSYVYGKMFKNTHCSLCDITHNFAWKKRAWRECETNFGVPIDLVHLNEQDKDLLAFTEGKTPCVVGQLADGSMVMLLDSKKLESMKGSVDTFQQYLKTSVL